MLTAEEAAGGAGVIMGHQALVARPLDYGALAAPFAERVSLPGWLRPWSARPLRAGSAVQRVAAILAEVGRRG